MLRIWSAPSTESQSPTEWFLRPVFPSLSHRRFRARHPAPAPAPMVTCLWWGRAGWLVLGCDHPQSLILTRPQILQSRSHLGLWQPENKDTTQSWEIGLKYWRKFYYLQVVDIVSCLSGTKFIFHKCFHFSSILFLRLPTVPPPYTSETFHKSQKLSMEYLNNTHSLLSSPQIIFYKHFCIPLNVFAFVIKISPETQ